MDAGPTVLAVLLVGLALAGCTGSAPADPGEAGPAGQATNDTAGNATGAVEDNRTDPADAGRHRSFDVDWEGKIPAGACVPSGLNSCTGADVPDGETRFKPAPVGTPVNASLVLTWNATQPHMESLVLTLTGIRTGSCGSSCTAYYYNNSHSVQGPSPLQLDVPNITLGTNETLHIVVSQPRQTPDPIYAYARWEQPFHVQGEVVVRA